MFGSIALGETVCGTAGVDETLNNGTRDTDWYEFTVTAADTYRFEVVAEFPAVIFVVDSSVTCANPSAGILGSGTTTGCGDVAAIQADLLPGTYWFFVAPSFFSPSLVCGAQYSATFGVVPPIQAIPTLSRVGIVVIALLLAGLAFVALRRRRAPAA